jgi:hypothetical protein
MNQPNAPSRLTKVTKDKIIHSTEEEKADHTFVAS